MKNSKRIAQDLEKSNFGSGQEILSTLLKENSTYINSFDASIYPEGLLSCIESHAEKKKDYNLLDRLYTIFYKIYPNH